MERELAIETGRWIFSAWKHVRRYDAHAQPRMGATAHAGKAGDLLGRLRMLERYDMNGLEALATDAGISSMELGRLTLPALESARGLHQIRTNGAVTAVMPLALDEDDVMAIITAVWLAVPPSPDERAAISALRCASALPRTTDEMAALCVADGVDEQSALRGIELAEAVGLVRRRVVPDLGVDLLYNEYLWGDSIGHTAEALARLPTQMKEGLVSLLSELHSVEGRPVELIESASPELVRFAAESGLIEQTEIVTSDGRSASFSFTPRMRGYGVAKDDVPDELDQVRLVIASFSFAHHHAQNRLDDPVAFVSRLLENGVGGRAKPIATDYGALEKQQIVSVEPIFPGAWAHQFVVVKKDALTAARDSMLAGEIVAGPARSGHGQSLLDSRRFRDPVDTRIRLGREGGTQPLHQAELLAAVRDAAQRTRPRGER